MHPPPPPSRPQTIKQAKASYKSRNTPALSEREKKQLERSIELDRRACRAKESEKRKAEAAKKRVEKERKEREEREKRQIGSQRRCDRFGFRGSQMHLGSFVKKAEDLKRDDTKHGKSQDQRLEVHVAGSLDDYGLNDDDSDISISSQDEAMMGLMEWEAADMKRRTGKTMNELAEEAQDAMMESIFAADERKARRTKATVTRTKERPPVRKEATNTPQKLKVPVLETGFDDLSAFLGELGSSTQIARELAADALNTKPEQSLRSLDECRDLDDFDLTVEDIEEIEEDDFDLTVEDIEDLENKPPLAFLKAEQDRKLMPPPALPPKKATSNNVRPFAKSAPPQPLVHGFTMIELESFVDDDLQLTQVDPG